MPAPFSGHVLTRTVVLPELRVVFLPLPKAGCTTVLQMLAELAGLDAESFDASVLPEVTPALTVHDIARWPAEHRLSEYEGPERERVLGEDGWLRFSLVRDPASRLWSAWQSKLLLREPRFVGEFGREPWFPRLPGRPAELLEDWRAFVASLGGDQPPQDVHWALQHDLVAQLPLTHVGRIERLDDTLTLLRAHLPADVEVAVPARQNPGALPMPPGAYDERAAAVLRSRYARDYEAFGYAPPEPGDTAPWEERVAPLLPVLRTTIAQHARIGQLARTAQRLTSRLEAAEQRRPGSGARQAGRARRPAIANVEGKARFDVRWAWADGKLAPGFTAVVRVKDEARCLPWVLPPLLRAVDRVLLLDNASTDGTVAVAREVAAGAGASDRLEVRSYPFRLARCGGEHLATPADSVRSLTYFYNWSFSQVRTAYALKWDGDMVLTEPAVAALRELAWQLESGEAVIRVPRHPLYVADDRRAFVDTSLRNCEPWGWPNRPGYSFVKAMEWELPMWGGDAATITLPEWSCFEIKHLDADEFAHWSGTDFEASARTRRKRREWEVFQALAAGGEPPDGVVTVHAPAARHVIEHVRSGGGPW